MPKAATKLAEAPSTPPASNSKAPLAVPNSSGPPTEASSSTVTVPDYGGSERPKGETSTVIRSTSPQTTEFGIWEVGFKSEVSHFSQYSRAAMLRVYAQETTFSDKKYDDCRLKLMAQRHFEQKIKDSHVKARNRDEDRPAIGAPSKRKSDTKRQRQCQKQFRERRLHTLDHEKPMFIWIFVRIQA